MNRSFFLISMKKILFLIFLITFFPLAGNCAQKTGEIPQKVEDVFMPEVKGIKVEEWQSGLKIPWSLVFFPDGRALVSERPGRIRLIKDGRLVEKPYMEIKVAHVGEGGLMGLAMHPDFPGEPFIYAMYTYEENGLHNRVIRIRDNGETGSFEKTILDGIPGGRFHDGGRLAFGPDGMLYITAGETFDAPLAQDLKSLGGKILRMTPDGEVPKDNPFHSPVYTYGNRNPQGIAWEPRSKTMFESEHGPSGEFGHFGHDEINIIVKGGNYGWPNVIGAPHVKGYIDPIIVWEKATPPSGIAFYNGDLLPQFRDDLFVATLGSECLIKIRLNRNKSFAVTRIERWFSDKSGKGKYGRLRDVVQGPDGALYFLTNNTDGRGSPRPGDDRIYRISPQ